MPFEIICSDVWGPAPNPSSSGSKYYVSFIDSFSRFTWIFFMKHKSEVFLIFRHFHAYVKNQFSQNIQILQCDGGGEYSSKEFLDFLQNNGMHRRVSCPYTPQQNEIAERKHRHIVESAMSMIHGSNLPISLWTEAFHTATHVINRLPMPILENQSPYYVLFGVHPDYNELRVFGCTCYVHIDKSIRTKFQDKASICQFVGYADEHKGYRCYDPVNKKIRISRNVVFDENSFLGKEADVNRERIGAVADWYDPWLSAELISQTVEHTTLTPESTHGETVSDDASQTECLRYKGNVYTRRPRERTNVPAEEHIALSDNREAPRRSGRIRHPIEKWVSYDNFSMDFQIFLSKIEKHDEPLGFHQAIQSSKWIEAMNEEIEALHECQTWEIVGRPPDKKCCWL